MDPAQVLDKLQKSIRENNQAITVLMSNIDRMNLLASGSSQANLNEVHDFIEGIIIRLKKKQPVFLHTAGRRKTKRVVKRR